MGWFDKKSWQLRRKIRDLQSELAIAERDGKYVVEQGLFFAELQEMGDATLMVFGTADHLDSEEDDIVRNFYDRNGFTVETLKLDWAYKTLAAIEIIPPEELTRKVARILKEQGYRLVDDSDQERPSNVEKKTITLSSLIRAVAALFTAHVHQLLISTPLKMNMEGNRLLHWTPLIREALLKKVTPEVVSLCRDPFITAYDHYYGQFGKMAHPEDFQSFTDEPSIDADQAAQNELNSQTAETSVKAPAWSTPPSSPAGVSPGAASRDGLSHLFETKPPTERPGDKRAIDGAHALARMYKALIGSSKDRQVRNAEVLLDIVAQHFGAKSVCLLYRRNNNAPFKLYANSGKSLCLDTGDDGTVTCDTEFLHKAISAHSITVMSSECNGQTHPAAVIAPLDVDQSVDCIIYVVEPGIFSDIDNRPDSDQLGGFVQVFREFPDLLLPKELSEIS